jgi:hypothetical protein
MDKKPINIKTFIPKQYIPWNKLSIGEEFIHENEHYIKTSVKESHSLDGGGLMILLNLETGVGRVPKKHRKTKNKKS